MSSCSLFPLSFSVNRRIFVVGFGLYGSIHGPTDYQVNIQVWTLQSSDESLITWQPSRQNPSIYFKSHRCNSNGHWEIKTAYSKLSVKSTNIELNQEKISIHEIFASVQQHDRLGAIFVVQLPSSVFQTFLFRSGLSFFYSVFDPV